MRAHNDQDIGKLSQLPLEMIERSVPAGCPIDSLVVFPKAETLLIPRPLGHFKCIALMRLADDTVWMLMMSGRGWTSHRLTTVAVALSGISENAYSKASIERLLRQKLGIESISLQQLVIGSVDAQQWGLPEIAFALDKRLAATRSNATFDTAGTALSMSSIETALHGGLREVVQEFVEGMAPQVLEIASANGQFNQRIYNYLAHSSFRRFRVQFAETFPSLLLTSALAERGTLGAELRSIVDSGAPLIKCLAERWNVRPGVVRHLVGISSNHVGIQWSRDAMGLALVLNALRPGDLPSDSAEAWKELNRFVAVGQQLFGRPIWNSPAGLEWLRECVCRAKRGTKKALGVWLPKWADVTRIVRFRDVLIDSLRRDSLNAESHSSSNVANDTNMAVDHLFLKLAHRDLVAVASQFDDELEFMLQETRADKVASGEMLLPLIPADFTSNDGTRLIRPLSTSSQLRFHGLELKNCLSGGGIPYIRGGSKGTNFIVGVFEKSTGDALSTAEIAVKRTKGLPRYKFVVKQHTAKRNMRPMPKCARAIAELLRFCCTDEVRAYLEDNWRNIQKRYRAHRGTWQLELDALTTAALRRTISDSEYDELLIFIREAVSRSEQRKAI